VVKHSNVGQKFSYALLALSPCVLVQKYLHAAGLDLGLRVLTSTCRRRRRSLFMQHSTYNLQTCL